MEQENFLQRIIETVLFLKSGNQTYRQGLIALSKKCWAQKKCKSILILILVLISAWGVNLYLKYMRPPRMEYTAFLYGGYLGDAIKNDKVIATVNGEPIYLSDVAGSLEGIFHNMESYDFAKKRMSKRQRQKEIYSYVLLNFEGSLNDTIEDYLLYEELKKEGNAPDISEVSKEANIRLKDFEIALKDPYSPEKVENYRLIKETLGPDYKEKLFDYYKRGVLLERSFYKRLEELMRLAPEPTKEEVRKFEKMGLSWEEAVFNAKVYYAYDELKKEEFRLRKSADVKITGLDDIKELAKEISENPCKVVIKLNNP